VLGSPLLIAQFHVFMLDAPETALVAVSMWLLLASEDFSRARMAGWAGLAVACGVLVKVQFPFFLAGIVLVALARGGWRHWRGLAVFTAVALVVGAPWYLDHVSEFGEIAHLAGAGLPGAPSGNYPVTFSTANLSWYAWSTLNALLFAPLFALALGGTIWTVSGVVRKQIATGPGMELLVGGFVAWLSITLTPHHDIRYDMPLMPYLAVIATGWIVHLTRAARLATIGVLVLAVAANTLGTTFGVGGTTEVKLVGKPPTNTQAFPDRILLYSSAGFLVAGPQRDGDVPGLLHALRRDGVRLVTFSNPENAGGGPPDFSTSGLEVLSEIARLKWALEDTAAVHAGPKVVALIHRPITPGAPPACAKLSDGTGVWVVRLQLAVSRLSLYCPFRHPHFYGTGAPASLLTTSVG
jgi:hypothetical protein